MSNELRDKILGPLVDVNLYTPGTMGSLGDLHDIEVRALPDVDLPPGARATLEAIQLRLLTAAEAQREALAMLTTLVGQLDGTGRCGHPHRTVFETFAGRQFLCPDCDAQGPVP